jgi:hypothetical protein
LAIEIGRIFISYISEGEKEFPLFTKAQPPPPITAPQNPFFTLKNYISQTLANLVDFITLRIEISPQ